MYLRVISVLQRTHALQHQILLQTFLLCVLPIVIFEWPVQLCVHCAFIACFSFKTRATDRGRDREKKEEKKNGSSRR